MKIITLIAVLITLSSCSELKNHLSENKVPSQPTQKNFKAPPPKKITEAKKNNTYYRAITGVLLSGVEYEAIPEPDGFVVSFIPFIAKKDDVFVSATKQIISKLYSDKISDESHISIESNIDYTIFKGTKARYRIVPYIESNGEISEISITVIL